MKEITAHTGLRGITALVVMFFHLAPDYFFAGFSATVLPYLFGHTAVDLFFILSGFILCYVYAVPGQPQPRGGHWNYHVARFARVYPLHLATLAFLGLLALVMLRRGAITGEYRLIDFFKQVFLVNGYPGLGPSMTWNYPAWSISIEYLAYLLIFPLFLRWRPARMHPAVVLLLVAVGTLAEVLYIVYRPEPSGSDAKIQHWLWIGVLRGFVGFLSGCLLHHVFTSSPRTTAFFQRRAAVCAVLALAVVILAGRGWFSFWWLLLAWPPLALALTSSAGWTGQLLSSRVALFFGNLSYSVYMLHAVAGKIVNATLYRRPGLLPSPWLQVAGVAYLLGVVLLAWLSFRFFEMPLRFWLRTLLNREPASVGPPSAASAAGSEAVRHGHLTTPDAGSSPRD